MGFLVLRCFLLDNLFNFVLQLHHHVDLTKNSLLKFPLEATCLNLVCVGEVQKLCQFVVRHVTFHDLGHDFVVLVETRFLLEDLFKQLIFR
jgi:hypothetical protein